MAGLDVYAMGVVHASVCAPRDMEVAEMLARVNSEHPTGVGPWVLSSQPFADGTPNPTDCDDHKENIHYLLEC